MGRIVYAPIVHESLPFARAVREAFERERPDCVAVELPETLSAPVARAVARLPLLSLLRWRDGADPPSYLVVEPCDGVFEALRLAHEHRVPAHLVDRDTARYGAHHDQLPDPAAIDSIGYEAYVAAVEPALGAETATPDDVQRERTMAFHLARLAERHACVLFVCGLAHAARVRALVSQGDLPRPLGRTRRDGVEVLHLHEASSREVLGEPPWVQARWERLRADGAALGAARLDRVGLAGELLLEARARMAKDDGERVESRALALAMRYAQNLARVRGALAPSLADVVVAARGVGSDDFAWHAWDLATAWPWQADPADLPTYRVTLEELARGSRRLWLERRKKTRRHLLRVVRDRPHAPAGAPFTAPDAKSPRLCSHPPEDVRVEAFGAHVRRRAKGLFTSERASVVPMTTGLADGLDLRETIRALAHDRRLRVREDASMPGEVSAVCVLFDPDDADDRYPWTLTWQGEHEGESDMALYATPPDARPVGPGVGRCEYGGFLMTWPPGRMFEVFEDGYFDAAATKGERLLLAAIDYAPGRLVAHVAPKPPRARLIALARRAGKKVLHVPLGQLSPDLLRKIRVFHVLEGHHVRSWARSHLR